MSDLAHKTTTTKFDNGVRTKCTCGWIDRWEVADGSAEQAAAEHKARYMDVSP